MRRSKVLWTAAIMLIAAAAAAASAWSPPERALLDQLPPQPSPAAGECACHQSSSTT